MQQFVKFVRRFFTPHFYGLCPEAPGYGIASLFAKCAAIWRTCHIFTAKGAAILGFQRSTRRHTAAQPSKCSAFGGRKRHNLHVCHFFKCCHATFVAFFLTHTIHTYIHTCKGMCSFSTTSYLDVMSAQVIGIGQQSRQSSNRKIT